MMKRGRKVLCVIALVLTAWVAGAGADIAILDGSGTAGPANNHLWLYNDDGTPKNIFSGSNQVDAPASVSWYDTAMLSNGDVIAVGFFNQMVTIFDGSDGSVKLTATGHGQYYKVTGLPNGGFAVGVRNYNDGVNAYNSPLLFYDAPTFDGSDWVLADPTVLDLSATTNNNINFWLPSSNNSADLTLAGGQAGAADPLVAVMSWNTSNSKVVQYYNKAGLQGSIDQDGTRGDAGCYGITADASAADASTVHQAGALWPGNSDFDTLVDGTPDAETRYNFPAGGSNDYAWLDVTVMPGDPATLLAIDSRGSDEGRGGDDIYKITLVDPVAPATVGTVTIEQFFDAPKDFYYASGYVRIDTYVIPEPATMVLLGVGSAGMLLARRRRRS